MSTCVSGACFQTSASMLVAEKHFIYTGHVSLRFGENGCNLQDLFPAGIDIDVLYEYDDQAVELIGPATLKIEPEELTVGFTIEASVAEGVTVGQSILVRFYSDTLGSISECVPLVLLIAGGDPVEETEEVSEGCMEDYFKIETDDCSSFFEYNIFDDEYSIFDDYPDNPEN